MYECGAALCASDAKKARLVSGMWFLCDWKLKMIWICSNLIVYFAKCNGTKTCKMVCSSDIVTLCVFRVTPISKNIIFIASTVKTTNMSITHS